MRELVLCVEKERLGQWDSVYEFGDVDRACYFLVEGRLNIVLENLDICRPVQVK